MSNTPIDETMSQEPAFATEKTEPSFVFDEVDTKDTVTAEEETETTETEDVSASTENKQDTVSSEEEENRVPYSRFKKVLDERDATQSTISLLEERLAELEKSRKTEVTADNVEIPEEWKLLYGDSEVSKKAWLVQQKREEQIQEKAVQTAIERLQKQQEENANRLVENEAIIDDNLSSLSEQLGKKLTQKQEEDILSIVDEFSPVGADGKYISLFPFDKAYEIYTLRTGAKTKVTQQQRTAVADLSGNSSQGETDTTGSNFQRGWDSWQKEL